MKKIFSFPSCIPTENWKIIGSGNDGKIYRIPGENHVLKESIFSDRGSSRIDHETKMLALEHEIEFYKYLLRQGRDTSQLPAMDFSRTRPLCRSKPAVEIKGQIVFEKMGCTSDLYLLRLDRTFDLLPLEKDALFVFMMGVEMATLRLFHKEYSSVHGDAHSGNIMMRCSFDELEKLIFQNKRMARFAQHIENQEFDLARAMCESFCKQVHVKMTLIDFAFVQKMEETRDEIIDHSQWTEEQIDQFFKSSRMPALDEENHIMTDKILCSLDYFILFWNRLKMSAFFRSKFYVSESSPFFKFLVQEFISSIDVSFTLNMMNHLREHFDDIDTIPDIWRKRWYLFLDTDEENPREQLAFDAIYQVLLSEE
jgi:hypothetical protein